MQVIVLREQHFFGIVSPFLQNMQSTITSKCGTTIELQKATISGKAASTYNTIIYYHEEMAIHLFLGSSQIII